MSRELRIPAQCWEKDFYRKPLSYVDDRVFSQNLKQKNLTNHLAIPSNTWKIMIACFFLVENVNPYRLVWFYP